MEPDNIETKAAFHMYKILDEVNRNVVLATRVISEDLGEVEAIVASQKNFNDMISMELNKKSKKMACFLNFLIETKVIDMMNSYTKAKLMESKEIISCVIEIRASQRSWNSKNEDTRAVCKELYHSSIHDFLTQNGFSLSQSYTFNADQFYLYPVKSHEIIGFMIAQLKEKGAEKSDFWKRTAIKIIARLIVSIISSVQATRRDLE